MSQTKLFSDLYLVYKFLSTSEELFFSYLSYHYINNDNAVKKAFVKVAIYNQEKQQTWNATAARSRTLSWAVRNATLLSHDLHTKVSSSTNCWSANGASLTRYEVDQASGRDKFSRFSPPVRRIVSGTKVKNERLSPGTAKAWLLHSGILRPHCAENKLWNFRPLMSRRWLSGGALEHTASISFCSPFPLVDLHMYDASRY